MNALSMYASFKRNLCRWLLPVALITPVVVAGQSAVDTEGSFRWDEPTSWNPPEVPNGVNAEVTIDKLSGLDRDIDLGPDDESQVVFTIGRIFSTNNTEFRNRVRRGSIVFEVSDGNAEIHTSGTGEGRFEFRMDGHPNQFVRLNSTLDTYIDQEDEQGGQLRFRGSLEGPGGLTLNRRGEVRFRESDFGIFNATYQGPTIIREGMLRLRSANLVDTESIEVHDGGQLRLDARHGGDPDGPPMVFAYNLGSGTITLNGMGREEDDPVIGGPSGALRQHGHGTADDVATVLNDIVLASDAAIHSNSNIPVGGSILHLTGSLSGPGRLVKSGGGTLHLHGSNETGGTVIENGTLVLHAADALPTGELVFIDRDNDRALFLHGDHTVALLDGSAPDTDEAPNNLTIHLAEGGTFTVFQDVFFDDAGEEDDTRFQGDISGAGSFVKAGDGILRLTRHAKTYTGSTTIAKGVLEVSETAALPNTSEISVHDGGQLRLSTSGASVHYDFGGILNLRGSGRGGDVSEEAEKGIRGALRYDPGAGASHATVNSSIHMAAQAGVHVNAADKILVLAGSMTGTGNMVRSGAGVVVLSGNNPEYTGGTIIDNGVTRVTADSRLGSGHLRFREPVETRELKLENAEQTVNSLSGEVSGGGNARIELSGGTTLNVAQRIHTRFQGSIDGPGNLRKQRGGTLTLDGTHALSREVIVEGGTLINHGSLAGVSALSIADNGAIAGTGDWGGDAVVGGTLRLARAVESPAFLGDLEFEPNSRLVYGLRGLDAPGAQAPASVAGDLRFSANTRIGVEFLESITTPVNDVYPLFDVAGAIEGLDTVSLALPEGLSGTLVANDGTVSLELSGTPQHDRVGILEATFGNVVMEEDGSVSVPWYGRFRVDWAIADNIVLHHDYHGWQYAVGTAGPWVYDYAMGEYLWTSRHGVYPYFYSATRGWLYYFDGSRDPRWFYQFSGDDAGWLFVD